MRSVNEVKWDGKSIAGSRSSMCKGPEEKQNRVTGYSDVMAGTVS